MCGSAAYCVVGRCNVWYGGVLCGRAVLHVCVVVWRTVWLGGVLCVMVPSHHDD